MSWALRGESEFAKWRKGDLFWKRGPAWTEGAVWESRADLGPGPSRKTCRS